MTASAQQLPPRLDPLPAPTRYGIATASSVAVHLVVLLLFGLFTVRAPRSSEVLIPIELTVSGQPGEQLELGGGGHPQAPTERPSAPSTSTKPSKATPSSLGGKAKAAPAPPKLLTSKRGTDPAGSQGKGKEAAGSGGQQEAPAGPTRGPGVIGGPAPIYPKDALDRNLTGRVTLAVAVGAEGIVSSVTVKASSGHEVLDEAAVRAIKRAWTFQPGLKDGKPTPGTITVTFEFTDGKVESR